MTDFMSKMGFSLKDFHDFTAQLPGTTKVEFVVEEPGERGHVDLVPQVAPEIVSDPPGISIADREEMPEDFPFPIRHLDDLRVGLNLPSSGGSTKEIEFWHSLEKDWKYVGTAISLHTKRITIILRNKTGKS